MSVINLLDKRVYNRISAGEVVERPASVVKELVENAVDSGATEISVEIENGGIASIKVADNGSGVERKELPKVFLPHATSKITVAEDLERIGTLGFRGEALASIGAVAHCSFISKTAEEETASAINCSGGDLTDVYDCPAQNGTTVVCRDLFFNTPARSKFLKTARAEEGEVEALILKMALSRPNVAFKLVADGKTKIQTFGGGLKECITSVYGPKTLENCFEVERVKNGINVSGFVGKLSFTKPTRAYQTLIVNGRFVVDSTVSAAVTNAYGSYLMKRQYPFYVLNLELPPETVDVNVHPRKAEVRFSDNQVVYGAVYSTVSGVLDGTSVALDIIKDDGEGYSPKTPADQSAPITSAVLGRSFSEEKTQTKDLEQAVESSHKTTPSSGGLKSFFGSGSRGGFSYADSGRSVAVYDSAYGGEAPADPDEIFAENKRYAEKLAAEKVKAEQQKIEIEPETVFVGQLFNTYLIFQYGDDCYMIDQHAAHERLLYDKLVKKAERGMLDVQPLLLPYVFKVPREEFDGIYKRFRYFRELGIEIDNVGDDTFKVSAMPCELCSINLKEFFDDLLYDDGFKTETIPVTLKEKLMQTACKHAIKGGDSLDRTEIDALMSEIKGDFGLRCPHGRPIAVKITKTEIEKWFKRIV